MYFLIKEHSEIACRWADDSAENWCALNQGVFGLSGSGRKVYFLFCWLVQFPLRKTTAITNQLLKAPPNSTGWIIHCSCNLSVQMARTSLWLSPHESAAPGSLGQVVPPLPALSSEALFSQQEPFEVTGWVSCQWPHSSGGTGLSSKQIFRIHGICFEHPLNKILQETNMQWIRKIGFIIMYWFLSRDHPCVILAFHNIS